MLGHAAVDAKGADAIRLPSRLHHHRALHRKLARGRQHEEGGAGLGAFVEALPQDVRQSGQPEPQRLACVEEVPFMEEKTANRFTRVNSLIFSEEKTAN